MIETDTPQRLIDRLTQEVGPSKFKLWFGSARFSRSGDDLLVRVPNRFTADWIDHHFHDALLAIAEQELGVGTGVNLRVDPAALAQPVKTTGRGRQTTGVARPTPGKPANPFGSLRHDLSDFVVGPSNELAFNTASALIDARGHHMGVLYVHGACGVGKTHLLQGICRRFKLLQPARRCQYLTAEQFVSRYVQAVRTNTLNELRRRLRKLDLLAIDDVQFLSQKAKTQTEFQHTFDQLAMQGAKVVLASDAPPRQVPKVAEALTSRFLSGMVVQIEKPDPVTRRRLIQTLARRRGLTLRPAVVDEMIQRCSGSVREIEGTLTKLTALVQVAEPSRRMDQPIGRALIDQLWPPTGGSSDRRPVRLDEILQTVCQDLGVEQAKVMSKSKHRRIVVARSVVVFLARRLTTLSYPELARALGRPNHSTVVTAAQRIEKQIRERKLTGLPELGEHSTIDQLVDRLHKKLTQGGGKG